MDVHPTKDVSIGIDPYPSVSCSQLLLSRGADRATSNTPVKDPSPASSTIVHRGAPVTGAPSHLRARSSKFQGVRSLALEVASLGGEKSDGSAPLGQKQR